MSSLINFSTNLKIPFLNLQYDVPEPIKIYYTIENFYNSNILSNMDFTLTQGKSCQIFKKTTGSKKLIILFPSLTGSVSMFKDIIDNFKNCDLLIPVCLEYSATIFNRKVDVNNFFLQVHDKSKGYDEINIFCWSFGNIILNKFLKIYKNQLNIKNIFRVDPLGLKCQNQFLNSISKMNLLEVNVFLNCLSNNFYLLENLYFSIMIKSSYFSEISKLMDDLETYDDVKTYLFYSVDDPMFNTELKEIKDEISKLRNIVLKNVNGYHGSWITSNSNFNFLFNFISTEIK